MPTEKAAKIALRTQQIIAHEIGVTNTPDPLAGSYFVEKLTDEIEAEAEAYFQKINDLGGVIPAIKQGFQQREIATAARRYQDEFEAKDRIIVGVNEYAEENEKLEIPILKIDQSVEKAQLERLQQLRASRDNGAVEAELERLRVDALANKNVMPALIDCAKAYCTVGEMIGVLREVYGTWVEEPVF